MPPQIDSPTHPEDPSFHKISVIVPVNPFIRSGLGDVRHCLAALDVVKLMDWWPGKPHFPHRNPAKVRSIQRSLDWKRVAQIAAYLLQREVVGAPEKIQKYFAEIYAGSANEPGREWPPRLPKVVRFQRSGYPTFSNVLLHVNGATLEESTNQGIANLRFDQNSPDLNFSVIDGQHRINGAFFAVCLLREEKHEANWDIPSEIFIDLDQSGQPPRHQAQIFIDVNFYQKKVDRSLVADLFPTARGHRDALDEKERAQDLGRKLMLETGPLVGMVQIPGIKFGVADVVTLATLNSAIEDILGDLYAAGIESLEAQAEFLAICLEAWLDATGRREDVSGSESLDPENVAYQGRAIVSFLTLVPACIWHLRKNGIPFSDQEAKDDLETWLKGTMKRARLTKNGRFLAKGEFKAKGFVASGGLARFRDTLWIAATSQSIVPARLSPQRLADLASESRSLIRSRPELRSEAQVSQSNEN
ncbi:MAG TPA: DGQHR domain-containing protein [Candidatus Eisenbacteria bacterium]|nr:DGQHR domain-containing protein [Candidatus Eisenbacteria bacterium]